MTTGIGTSAWADWGSSQLAAMIRSGTINKLNSLAVREASTPSSIGVFQHSRTSRNENRITGASSPCILKHITPLPFLEQQSLGDTLMSCVLALKSLQKDMMFSPACPSAGPTGGAGFAPPAGMRRRIVFVMVREAISDLFSTAGMLR